MEIDKLYDNLSYFDKYGGTMIIFMLVNIIFFYLCVYFQLMKQSEEIKSDWGNNRCNPKVIPFAGLINRPENKTILEYTKENWDYCIQNTLTAISSDALQPLTYITSGLGNIFSEIANGVNAIRKMMSLIRTNMSNITEDILGRVLNILTPLQQMMIAFKDSMLKIQGILTAGLYTSLGTYYTLKSVLGAIVQFIITILVILVILIVGMWITPATWGMAISMSAVYASIAIPLAVIVIFMKDVLHVETGGIPKLRCFVEKPKCDDLIGMVKVNGKGLNIYKLEGILVSGSHLVENEKREWIRVEEHSKAEIIINKKVERLYCPITKSKVIKINGITYSDWDEIFKENSEEIGYENGTLILGTDKKIVKIEEIEIGEILFGGIEVYGIVEYNSGKKHILTNDGYFYLGKGKKVKDYNNEIESILTKKWK